MHKFVLIVAGKLQVYNSWESLPEEFDHVIEFIPHIPEGPHSDEQHEEINQWPSRLAELMERCKY